MDEEELDLDAIKVEIESMREELKALTIRRSLLEVHLGELRDVAADLNETHDKVEAMAREVEKHLAGESNG